MNGASYAWQLGRQTGPGSHDYVTFAVEYMMKGKKNRSSLTTRRIDPLLSILVARSLLLSSHHRQLRQRLKRAVSLVFPDSKRILAAGRKADT